MKKWAKRYTWANRPDIDITKLQGYEKNREEYGHIYITRNIKNNNKPYIGYCTQKINSIKEKQYLGSGRTYNKAKKKYGLENFIKEILHICYEEQNMYAWEMIYKRKYKSFAPNGYNIQKCSEGRSPMKDLEARKKASKTLKERFKDKTKHPRFGAKFIHITDGIINQNWVD